MAQFSMEAYQAQQAAKRSANASKGNNGRSTRFVNEFIKNDGDTVVVRLPYHSLDDLIYAVDSLASLYELSPNGEYETSYKWDDSIIIDAEVEREQDRQDVSMGVMRKSGISC